MTNKFRVTFDGANDNAFHVHTPQKIVQFARNHSNLCVHKPSKLGKAGEASRTVNHPVQLLNAVDKNKKFMTPGEII